MLSQQPHALIEPERDIEVLYCLTCGALHQVVETRNHHVAVCVLVDLPSDFAEVRLCDVLDFGQHTACEAHERCLGVCSSQHACDLRICSARFQEGVNGLQNPTVEGHQGRP